MIKIKLTPEDIQNGLRQNNRYCPIALALSRDYPQYTWSVGTSRILGIRKSLDERSISCIPTQRVQRFIARFDSYREVKPQTFILY